MDGKASALLVVKGSLVTGKEDEGQRVLDQLALQIGMERTLKEGERLASSGDYGLHKPLKTAVEETIPLVAEALREIIEGSAGAGSGHRRGNKASPALVILRQVQPEALAAIAMHELMASIGRRKSELVTVALNMGHSVFIQLWLDGLLETDPKLAERLVRGANLGRDRRERLRRLRKLAEAWGVHPPEMDRAMAVKIGSVLLHALIRCDIATLWYRQDDTTLVVLTDTFGLTLAQHEHGAAWLRPQYGPLLSVPPRWKHPAKGPYVLKTGRPVALVRGRSPDLYLDAVETGRMEPVLSALDRVAATAWRIDRGMWELVRWSVEENIPIAKTPSIHLLELPEAPADWKERWSPEEVRAHKTRRADIRKENNRIKGDIVRWHQMKRVIEALGSRAFFIPYNLDFRGRLYPIAQPNYQMAGWVRHVMRFADARPLGEGGAFWLAVHVANTWGLDKRPLAERVKWTYANLDLIRAVADRPKERREWTSADSPWAFLAACREWAAMEAWEVVEGSRETFPSGLPISVDASNSGLQHYAAMMRSEADGRLVNLLPGDPQDVYGTVAERVRELVEADRASEGEEADLAVLWLNFGVSRSVVKRSVMTYPYSSRAYGFREQIAQDLMQPLQTKVVLGELSEHPLAWRGDRGWKAAGYLATKIWRAVTEVVADAGRAMAFFQSVAGALAHVGRPVTWETPVGFPVVQAYREMEVSRITVPLALGSYRDLTAGRPQRISLAEPTDRIKKSKQKSAIAPNVVHSMDASHMVLAVNYGHENGITSWGVIHDSWATHAGAMDTLFGVLRETFVSLYEQFDPLAVLRASAWEVLDEKGRKRLPEVPEKGSLDLRGTVLGSLYCFA